MEPAPIPVELVRGVLAEAVARSVIDAERAERAWETLSRAESARAAAELVPGLELPDALRRRLQERLARTRGAPTLPEGTRGSASLRPGSRVGPYRIVRVLGRGAMGTVFEARGSDEAPVALKVVEAPRDERARARFVREVRALETLDHPHVVRLLAADPQAPVPWLAMELVVGGDLEERLAAGPLPPEVAADVLSAVAEALAQAHERGVVHRDLKPANLLIDAYDRVRVSDFGLAREVDAESLTRSGTLLGTLSTMAPEQLRGERHRVGAPSDVWALGVILYRCLTGTEPFEGDSPLSLAAAASDGRYLAPSRACPGLPAWTDAVCKACLQVDPGRRRSAAEIALALRARRAPPGVGAKAWRWPTALASAGAILLAGALWSSARSSDPTRDAAPEGAPTASLTSSDPTAHPEPERPPGILPDRGGVAWTPRWSLRAGESPRIEGELLWELPGRIAAPLPAARGERGAGGLEEALFGEARVLGDGRVGVYYPRPAEVLRAQHLLPGRFFQLHERPELVFSLDAGGAGLVCVNDALSVNAWLGRARWSALHLSLGIYHREEGDKEGFFVRLGGSPERDDGDFVIGVVGRTERVTVYRGPEVLAVVPWVKPAVRVELAAEVRLNGARAPEVEGELAQRPLPAGGVRFNVDEGEYALVDVRVEGRCERPDRAAIAWAPPIDRPGADLRVEAEVTRELDGQGGPFVGLMGPSAGAGERGAREGYRLEWSREQLVLTRAGAIVAVAPAPAEARGALRLERRDDVVRGTLITTAGRVELVRVDPVLQRVPELGACYGSTAARAEFHEVLLAIGRQDVPRAEAERACGIGGPGAALPLLEQAGRSDPRALWRYGALALATVSEPAWVLPDRLGAAGRLTRQAVARRAAQASSAAARALEQPEARVDAAARTVLAAVVAGEPSLAEEAARSLVELAGLEAGQRALDQLMVVGGRPALIAHFTEGYATVADPKVRGAGFLATSVVAPDRAGAVLLGLGDMIRDGQGDLLSTGSAAGPAEALAVYERARAAGAPDVEVDRRAGDALMLLERWADASATWQRALEVELDWWPYRRQAQCLAKLGRPGDALESALGGLSLGGARRGVRKLVTTLAQSAELQTSRPGLCAAAVVAVTHFERAGSARVASLQKGARTLATRTASADTADGDLARYALLQLGTPVEASPSQRPTALLARARAGDAAAVAALTALPRTTLVRHLARLDPVLAIQ